MRNPIAVLDSCVLFPFYLRDLLLHVAEEGLYRPRWSQKIWDDAMRNLIREGQMTREQVQWLEENVNAAFPNAIVQVPPELVDMMLNHPGDRHVLAAAVVAKASVILTINTKDFPAKALAPWKVEAQKPDKFLMSLYSDYPEEVFQCVVRQASNLKRPPKTVPELIALLARQAPHPDSEWWDWPAVPGSSGPVAVLWSKAEQEKKQRSPVTTKRSNSRASGVASRTGQIRPSGPQGPRYTVEWQDHSYIWDGMRWYDTRTHLVPPTATMAELNRLVSKQMETDDDTVNDRQELLERAKVAREAKQYDRAERILQRILSESPEHPPALAILCPTYRDKGQPRQALEVTEEYKHIRYAPLWTSRAAALCDLNRWEEAKKQVGRVFYVGQISDEALNG